MDRVRDMAHTSNCVMGKAKVRCNHGVYMHIEIAVRAQVDMKSVGHVCSEGPGGCEECGGLGGCEEC